MLSILMMLLLFWTLFSDSWITPLCQQFQHYLKDINYPVFKFFLLFFFLVTSSIINFPGERSDYVLIADLCIRIGWLKFRDASLCEEISRKTYSRGCQRPARCGRMSKLAFLFVRRLSPGELLIFMQTRQWERCDAAVCKTISNLKPMHTRPTNN